MLNLTLVQKQKIAAIFRDQEAIEIIMTLQPLKPQEDDKLNAKHYEHKNG
jgi:hypothetical protein